MAVRISLGGGVAAGAATCGVSDVAGRDVKGRNWCRTAVFCRWVAQSEQNGRSCRPSAETADYLRG